QILPLVEHNRVDRAWGAVDKPLAYSAPPGSERTLPRSGRAARAGVGAGRLWVWLAAGRGRSCCVAPPTPHTVAQSPPLAPPLGRQRASGVAVRRGWPPLAKQQRNFFLDLNHRLGLFQTSLQSSYLALELRHLVLEWVARLRFASGRE